MRDKSLTRLGLIRPEELSLKVQPTFNNVGTWSLSLAYDHPLTEALRTPGGGVIITGPTDVILSGPVVTPTFATSAQDPAGTVTFDGVSDDVVLADMLAYPDPTNPDGAHQTLAHDVRSGPAETVIHAYVNANVGPSAPVQRRKAKLTMGANLGRGPTVSKSARFPVLGNLLAEIAVVADLGFRVIQRDDVLVFETYLVSDKSREIRLDTRTGTLSGQKVAISPPGVTRAIVAGQGDLTERQFLEVDTAESLAAEVAWGRRIEQFIDQRQTDDWNELQQAGDEAMANSGFTSVAVQAIPMEDSVMEFGHDWYLGDKVTVVVEDQELASTATGMSLLADSNGFKIGALLGDASGFDPQVALSKRVQNTETRVSQLEQNVSAADPQDDQIMRIMGVY
ncbi:siphovirus ReqiPepy6 Gp37-like family protein [Streptomyces sp. NBC_01198]|uniref:siphovirus ReqiPepy6 Gp37-like family protein n=1 Tax=Streptomyces sp. NBC_01198 TaxID=2903769 RepID=UPI002E153DB9|nr:siphovirus ReqiPepy6 Gp37-like family protein [Streptomyces sp. NBC_01198]